MKSVNHCKIFEIAAPIGEVFPLFSPEGEKLWVPGWNYNNVMGTTELAEDYVFLTSTHDHATTDAIWLVKKYTPELHFVQFYKIEPGDKIGVVTVRCAQPEPRRTSVEVTYKYMALSEVGEQFVAEFDEQAYEQFIAEWETLLADYFRK